MQFSNCVNHEKSKYTVFCTIILELIIQGIWEADYVFE